MTQNGDKKTWQESVLGTTEDETRYLVQEAKNMATWNEKWKINYRKQTEAMGQQLSRAAAEQRLDEEQAKQAVREIARRMTVLAMAEMQQTNQMERKPPAKDGCAGCAKKRTESRIENDILPNAWKKGITKGGEMGIVQKWAELAAKEQATRYMYD